MSERLVIVECVEGRCIRVDVVTGILEDVVKEVAREALNKWNVSDSDFFISHDYELISKKLPLSKETFEVLSKYNLQRRGNEAIARVPVYEISYSNQWDSEKVLVKSIIVIAPYIDETFKKELVDYAVRATSLELQLTESENLSSV